MANAAADRPSRVRRLLDAALDATGRVGADPADSDEVRVQKALLVLIAILVLPVSFTWATLYLGFGSWTGWLAAIYAAISISSLLVFARTRNLEFLLWVQLLDILISPTVSMLPLGGFLPSGAVGIWGILAPLGALVFRGVQSGIRWYVAFVAIFLGSGLLGIALHPPPQLPEWFSSTILALNVTVGGTMFFILLTLFARQREDALGALQSEHARAEGLLLNILPGSIAERLKSSPTTIADQFRAVSVLFADVVDFTPRSRDLPAADVVGMLDRLFSHFDELAERYDLEKIKTIGDAYMVAAGVPEPRPDHAQIIANLALDMVASLRPGGAVADLKMELRIGINSGPVVAGVIGRKRFLYDLWGDAVNTASRMESQGTPGRIQVTAATRDLLGDAYLTEYRGTVEIKGRGRMETWYLVGRR